MCLVHGVPLEVTWHFVWTEFVARIFLSLEGAVKLRVMGIAPDHISHAAFGQHARKLEVDVSITYCAIRGVPHSKRNRASRICGFVLRDGVAQCPRTAKRGGVLCSRHSKRTREIVSD
jgi:hypothetical protein